jgi:hypothetical protein
VDVENNYSSSVLGFKTRLMAGEKYNNFLFRTARAELQDNKRADHCMMTFSSKSQLSREETA